MEFICQEEIEGDINYFGWDEQVQRVAAFAVARSWGYNIHVDDQSSVHWMTPRREYKSRIKNLATMAFNLHPSLMPTYEKALAQGSDASDESCES